MDRFQLCRALRAAGVPEAYYDIPGCTSGPRPPGDRYFLEERDGQWIVGVSERGTREVLERFPDEDGACRRLHARLTDEGPPLVEATPEEIDVLLHDAEGIQRRAREDFERALAEARRRDPGTTAPGDGDRTDPPLVEATPEEIDVLLHDAEGIQRRAREDFERALAEARRRDPGTTAPGDGDRTDPPLVEATPEEIDVLLHDAEGIQRRAREDFERALAEARRRAAERPAGDDGRTDPPRRR
ncbi:hypothetical protein [Streptomyces bungoensis]|uniref:hypothetical protein n=1 Tax=Streptomyces bungoensis TaxID=285568 RepID=UPI00342850C8